MQSGACYLADRKKAPERCRAFQISLYSAALVVGRRNDGDRLPGHVDSKARTCFENVRKSISQERRGLMRNIDVHAFGAGPLHLSVNCARDDVAWRQGGKFVIFRHELAPGSMDQFAALSPHRLANQERLHFRMKQACRMELNKFHVGHCCPCPPSHCNSIAGRDTRVRGVEINLSAAAGGENDAIAPNRFDNPGSVIENIDANYAILSCVAEFTCGDQVNGHMIVENLDVAFLDSRIKQTLLDLAACRIMIMEDTSLGVPAFLTQIQLLLAVLQHSFFEMDSNPHEFPDSAGPFGDDRPHGFLIAKTGTSDQGVLYMKVERVLGARDARDPALGPSGV